MTRSFGRGVYAGVLILLLGLLAFKAGKEGFRISTPSRASGNRALSKPGKVCTGTKARA